MLFAQIAAKSFSTLIWIVVQSVERFSDLELKQHCVLHVVQR